MGGRARGARLHTIVGSWGLQRLANKEMGGEGGGEGSGRVDTNKVKILQKMRREM